MNRTLIVGCIGLGMVICSLGGNSLAGSKSPRYDECVLKHLPGTKLDEVAELILAACEANYKRSVMNRDNKHENNECLLSHIKGVESLRAAQEISEACHRKHLD